MQGRKDHDAEVGLAFIQNALCFALEKRKQPQAALDAALAEKRRVEDILGGVNVRAAEKAITRAIGPINEEITALRKELAGAPPAVIATFLEDSARKIETLRAAKGAAPNILKTNYVGDALVAERYDNDQIDATIEAIKRNMTLASDLALEALNEAELAKRVEALRSIPLPEVQTLRFSRESSAHSSKEIAV
jgi:hypothetical protein